jgi:hypothetical protein
VIVAGEASAPVDSSGGIEAQHSSRITYSTKTGTCDGGTPRLQMIDPSFAVFWENPMCASFVAQGTCSG